MKNSVRRIASRLLHGFGRRRRRSAATPFCDKGIDDLLAEGCIDKEPQNRVLIITQPKAGTYLAAEILSMAGFHNTHLHLGLDRLQAYDKRFLSEGIARPRQFDVAISIEQSRKLIRFGEVAVSHLPYSNELEVLISNYKIIHIKRELRSAFRSWARMLLYSNKFGEEVSSAIRREGIAGFMRVRGKVNIVKAININGWRRAKNVHSITLEELLSDPEKEVANMLEHVGSPLADNAPTIWSRVTQMPTLTSSEKYPELSWTPHDELVFKEIGGPAANKVLGYDE